MHICHPSLRKSRRRQKNAQIWSRYRSRRRNKIGGWGRFVQRKLGSIRKVDWFLEWEMYCITLSTLNRWSHLELGHYFAAVVTCIVRLNGHPLRLRFKGIIIWPGWLTIWVVCGFFYYAKKALIYSKWNLVMEKEIEQASTSARLEVRIQW